MNEWNQHGWVRKSQDFSKKEGRRLQKTSRTKIVITGSGTKPALHISILIHHLCGRSSGKSPYLWKRSFYNMSQGHGGLVGNKLADEPAKRATVHFSIAEQEDKVFCTLYYIFVNNWWNSRMKTFVVIIINHIWHQVLPCCWISYPWISSCTSETTQLLIDGQQVQIEYDAVLDNRGGTQCASRKTITNRLDWEYACFLAKCL